MARGFLPFQIIDQRRAAKAAERDAFQAAIQKDRETSIASATEFATIAEQAAKTGQMTPEQFEQFQVGALQALQRHAATLDQNRQLAVEVLQKEGGRNRRRARDLAAKVGQLPTGEAFVNEQLPMLESRFQAVQATAEQLRQQASEQQVETLPPEEAAQLGFPKGAVVQRKPDGTLSLAFDPSEDMSSLQEKFQALVATGVDEQRALGIAAGRYQVSVNAITDERVVLDLATGEPVGEPLDPKPQGGVPSMIPESVETDVATGAPGAIKNVVNVIGDSIGAGLAFPHAKEATEAIRSIQTFTVTTLQAEVPGRPSNFLMEELKELTVAPNSLFQGEEGAKTRFEQTSRLIEGEIARIEIDVLPLELPPNVRVETQLNLTQLKRLKAAYDDLLAGFDATNVEAPEGIPAEVREVWGFLTPEERELWMAKDAAVKGEQ